MMRFQNWSPFKCRMTLAGYGLVTIICLGVSLSDWRIDVMGRPPLPHGGDNQLYWDEVRRMKSGESYYESAWQELRRHGYPTRSIFNWRTPLPMWLLARLPSPRWGQMLIGTLAASVAVLFYAPIRHEFGIFAAGISTLLVLGALAQCFVEHVFILPMAWGAVLIGLSLGCFGANRSGPAVLFGCIAPFFRDLAFGYTLLMLLFAVRQRKRPEIAGSLAGVVAYLAFFYNHSLEVGRIIQDNDVVQVSSWLRLGGIPFLLATAMMNVLLLPLPQWVTAVYFPLALLGLAGWKSAWGVRVSTVAFCYLCLFFVAGQTFNNYWGTLIAPLLGMGAVVGVAGLRALVNGALPPRILLTENHSATE